MQPFIFILLALCVSPLLSVKHLTTSSSRGFCKSTFYYIYDPISKLYLTNERAANGNYLFFSQPKGDVWCFSPTGIIINGNNGQKLYHHTEKVNGVLQHTFGFDDGQGQAYSDYQWNIVKNYGLRGYLHSFYEWIFYTYNDGDVSETISLGATPTKIASGNWRDGTIFYFMEPSVGVM